MRSSDNSSFNEFYKNNINWMDTSTNIDETLKGRFSNFYLENGEPNFELLKAGIIKNDGKAKDLFKCLFKLPYILDNSKATQILELLENIEQNYGHSILAHGVEEAKGGGYNILMMMISNCVRVSAQYWGAFKKGPPNISPLAHGPYFIIATTNARNYAPRSNLPFNEILYVIVPFEENKQIMDDTSLKLLQHNLITDEQYAAFSSKLFTYEEFSVLLAAEIKLGIEMTAVLEQEILNKISNNQNHSIDDFAREDDELDGLLFNNETNTSINNNNSRKRKSESEFSSRATSSAPTRQNDPTRLNPRKLFSSMTGNAAANEETNSTSSTPAPSMVPQNAPARLNPRKLFSSMSENVPTNAGTNATVSTPTPSMVPPQENPLNAPTTEANEEALKPPVRKKAKQRLFANLTETNEGKPDKNSDERMDLDFKK